jgi:transposase-like protein
MIRLFAALCNTLLETLSDEAVFRKATEGFNHYGHPCPSCGAAGKLSPHGSYTRNLVAPAERGAAEHRVETLRFKCASCKKTHALLPGTAIPYSPYSLRFKLAVLLAYFEGASTIAAISGRFGIAASTVYEWKKRLLEHMELMLGALASRKEPAHAFLRGLSGSGGLPARLGGFFRRHAFSFLQNRPAPASRSLPP